MSGSVNMMNDLKNWRQNEMQAIGAAISRRDWFAVEVAYNQLRDKIDAEINKPFDVQHVKRGSKYHILSQSYVQKSVDRPIIEGDVMVTYTDGKTNFSRELLEFEDGRFLKLKNG